MVHQETRAEDVVKLALLEFGISEMKSNYSLYKVTVKVNILFDALYFYRYNSNWSKIDKNMLMNIMLNNKLHELSPPGGSVSPSGGFASLSFDQGVP